MRTGNNGNRPNQLAIVEGGAGEVGWEGSGPPSNPWIPPRRPGLVSESDCPATVGADLISIPETARRIGLHADTLYRLCRTGHFPPAIQIGGRWRVSIPRLERFLHGDDPMC
jgi:hypothetical protein